MNQTLNVNCWGVAIQVVPMPDGKWTWTLQAEDGTNAKSRTEPFNTMETAFADARQFCYLLMSDIPLPVQPYE